jgi:hypothetical protein
VSKTLWVSLESVTDGIYRRVCPLYGFDHRDHIYVVGSAVPFNCDGFRFLVSAAHVCIGQHGQPVPLFTMGAERPWALLGTRYSWEYRATETPDIDVAVITLEDACASDLEAYYQFTTPSDVAEIGPRTPATHFFVAGYPATRNRVRSLRDGLPSKATFLVARSVGDLEDLRLADKAQEHHFSLLLPAEPIRRLNADRFHLPQPHGMSGGGVWRFEVDRCEHLISTPRLVGISIEYHKNYRAFVATRVQAAIPLARDLWGLM